MGPGEALAILLAQLSEVIILFFQDYFCRVSGALIGEVILGVHAEVLVEFLFRKYVVFVLYYVLNIVEKTLIKSMKLRTHILRYDQFLLEQFLLILGSVIDGAGVLIDIFVLARVGVIALFTFKIILSILLLLIFHPLLLQFGLKFLLVLFLLLKLFFLFLYLFLYFLWILDFLALLLQKVSVDLIFTRAVFIFFLLGKLTLEPLTRWIHLCRFLLIIAALVLRVL